MTKREQALEAALRGLREIMPKPNRIVTAEPGDWVRRMMAAKAALDLPKAEG